MTLWWVSWLSAGSFEYFGPWWVSGVEPGGRRRSTICAAVVASDERTAREIIRHAHDDVSAGIEWRFVHPRPDDWSPFCDRFERAEWMRWPDG